MIVEFQDADGASAHAEFQNWRGQHPAGFMLKFKSGRKANLHVSTCGHFGDTEWMPEAGGDASLTRTLKVCAEGRRELTEWADRRGVALHPCQYCLPGATALEPASDDSMARDSNPAGAVAESDSDRLATADPDELDVRVARLRAKGRLSRPAGSEMPARTANGPATSFARDPAVVAWVLQEAAGTCDLCKQPAPFARSSGEPYLEVHHVVPLAQGGPDVVDNAVALCPTCHRRLHHGADAAAKLTELRAAVARLHLPEQPAATPAVAARAS